MQELAAKWQAGERDKQALREAIACGEDALQSFRREHQQIVDQAVADAHQDSITLRQDIQELRVSVRTFHTRLVVVYCCRTTAPTCRHVLGGTSTPCTVPPSAAAEVRAATDHDSM